MRYPQIVVYEMDGLLAKMVAPLAEENRWLVRESRQPEACLQLLREVRPTVLLLRLERELVDTLTLLQQVTQGIPDCPVIVVSDVKMDGADERLNLSGLAYDLGASYVLFPPLMESVIEDLVSGLMDASIARTTPAEKIDV